MVRHPLIRQDTDAGHPRPAHLDLGPQDEWLALPRQLGGRPALHLPTGSMAAAFHDNSSFHPRKMMPVLAHFF